MDDEPRMKFIRGKKNGVQLILEGYCYTKSRAQVKVTDWECCERSCRVRIRINNASGVIVN